MKSKILLVEDDPEIRELIRMYLEVGGFHVFEAEDAEQGMLLFAQESPELVILDILLPGMNGHDLCKEMKRMRDVPVIFVSCKRDAEDIIKGLELGGDDYMTKPFDPGVLVARVKTQLRRTAQANKAEPDNRVWKRDGLEVDLQTYEVRLNGVPVSLYSKERQLLLFFIQNPNKLFSVRQLYGHIWGWESESEERTVMVHISSLRKKIEEDPGNPKLIHTVRGFGYRFQSE